MKSGDIIDFTINTRKGMIDIAAEFEIDGKTLHFKDLIIYPRGKQALSGLTKEFLSLRSQLIKIAKKIRF